MAGESRLSTSSVQRIWRAFGLQPHRTETFKLSTDPRFIDKVRDVVGLYLNPPERALVLCVDEKSQIQPLDRPQPVRPMRPGQIERRSHDYKRHGTTSLFAALNTATGEVIGKCDRRHRAPEFKKFLMEIERRVPDDLEIHLVMDNYATHKTPAIRAWLARRPLWHVHFTPTSASWLNMVERFLAEITDRQIKRGVHRSERELTKAIPDYIETRNEDPKPFKWVRTADDILDAVKRFCLKTTPENNNEALLSSEVRGRPIVRQLLLEFLEQAFTAGLIQEIEAPDVIGKLPQQVTQKKLLTVCFWKASDPFTWHLIAFALIYLALKQDEIRETLFFAVEGRYLFFAETCSSQLSGVELRTRHHMINVDVVLGIDEREDDRQND